MGDNMKDNPDAHCLPMGNMQFHTHPQPRKIIQAPKVIVILDEGNAGIRQIFLDGRPLPNNDPQPVGVRLLDRARGKANTLVVQTSGFRDGGWLDVAGSPLTAQATMTERFRRPNFGTLEIEVTVNDPKVYTWPLDREHHAAAATRRGAHRVHLRRERDLDEALRQVMRRGSTASIESPERAKEGMRMWRLALGECGLVVCAALLLGRHVPSRRTTRSTRSSTGTSPLTVTGVVTRVDWFKPSRARVRGRQGRVGEDCELGLRAGRPERPDAAGLASRFAQAGR